MPGLRYIKGDATLPQSDGVAIICHVCNDIGGWGKGFVTAVSKRWSAPEAQYRRWYRDGEDASFALGAVQFVQVEPRIWIANMIGQHGIKRSKAQKPIRYDAVSECLRQVSLKAIELAASVHMPRIGCGLAGGEWSEIEPLIDRHLIASGVAVTVYDFE